jgi:hypothetical protein
VHVPLTVYNICYENGTMSTLKSNIIGFFVNIATVNPFLHREEIYIITEVDPDAEKAGSHSMNEEANTA